VVTGGRAVTGYPLPLVLADLFDVHGHRVTATTAGPRGEQLAVVTATADGGIAGGHPFLNQDHARVLGNALLEFANRGPQS
jgi:hypothetical protein